MLDQDFELQPGARTAFGRGVVRKVGRRIKALGKKSAFVVTDAGVKKAGIVLRVAEALDAERIGSFVFDGVTSNPTTDDVLAGAKELRKYPDAAVIALGGGSAIDAAKAIALLGPNGGKVSDYPFGCKPEKPGRPVVAIPTTSGTGSETNMFGVVTDPEIGRKVLIAHASIAPAVVILDPELCVQMPRKVTATTGMDALTHAIEAFTSTRANPFSDAIALRAIAMVAAYLPLAYADGSDIESRAQMLFASHLAGIAFTNSGLGICHAMGHPLSARLNVAHGQSLATLLPHIMRFNLEVSTVRYAQVAIAMGVADRESNEANAERAIEAVEILRTELMTDTPAASLGVTEELLPTLVDDALADPLMVSTPRQPSPEDVRALYEAAL